MKAAPPRKPIAVPLAAARPAEIWRALRQALSEVVRFDPGGFSAVAGARVALGVVVALVVGRLVGGEPAEAAMAVGALLAGVPGAVAVRRISLRAMVAVTLVMALSVFVGSATGELGWLHTGVLVPWCLAGGLLVSLGGPAASVGLQGIVAMIVFGQFAEPPPAALGLAGYVLAGGVTAIAALGLTRSPVTSAAQRRAVAGALAALAAMADAGATARSGVASAEELDLAVAVLGRSLQSDAEEAVQMRALVDVARRARIEMLAIEGFERRLSRPGGDPGAWRAAVEGALVEAAAVLRALGYGLRRAEPCRGGVAPFEEAVHSAQMVLRGQVSGGRGEEVAPCDSEQGPGPGRDRPAGAVAAALEQHLAALAGQLRAAFDLVHSAASRGPRHRPLRGVLRSAQFGTSGEIRQGLDILRTHSSLRSPVGRHAVRLAFVVTAAEILARDTGLDRGYWVALTAAVVIRPEFAATFSRGLARMVGTSVGVLLAGLLAIVLHSSTPAEFVAIGLLCAAACSTFRVSYALFSGFLTGLVVLLVGIVTSNTLTVAVFRWEDTLIGGALALVVYGLWPTWSQQQAPWAFATLALRQRAYLSAVLTELGGVGSLQLEQIGRLARDARLAKADADEALARAASEVEGRRFSLTAGQGIRAALSRVSLATHGLRADLEGGRIERPMPEIVPLARALSAALESASAGLERLGASDSSRTQSVTVPTSPGQDYAAEGGARVDGQPLALSSLRRYHEQLTAALEGRSGRGPLLAATDELVDAVNTLGALLQVPPTQSSG
jgi:uncharacterized membrane protein YccC